MTFKITQIFVDDSLEKISTDFIDNVAQKLRITPEGKNKNQLIQEMQRLPSHEMFRRAKEILFFTEQKGRFLKKCPGSRGVVCCNYYTINSVSGCPFDCSYCILQHYIYNNPFISVFVNRDKIVHEMGEYIDQHGNIRVGTGELADSLALDHLLDETGFFINEIKKNNWEKCVQFEFKTKSHNVERLVEVFKQNQSVNIVAGFSVNIEQFQQSDEHFTSTMQQRIDAMNRVTNAGAKISIHFDPIVMIERFRTAYISFINKLFSSIDVSKIDWISMGGFRHTLSLSSIIRERFPDSPLLAGEMFPCDKDNKLRYLSEIRRSFYKDLIKAVSKHMSNPPLYFCMEKKFMWDDLTLDPKKECLSHVFK